MAQPALDFFTKRALAAKIETVVGNDAAPTAALNGVMLLDGSSGTEVDKVERNVDRPYFGGKPFVVAGKRAFVEGTFELYPPATPGVTDADMHVMLAPGGLVSVKDSVAKTTTYNPVSAGSPSITAYFWHSGTLKKVLGARISLSELSMKVGERFTAKARIQGDYTTVTEQALPAVVLPNTVPTVMRADNSLTTILTVNGVAKNLDVLGKELSVDVGSDLTQREYTSKKVTDITNRDPKFKLRIARTAVADFDPWAVRDAGQIITAGMKLTEAGGAFSQLLIRGQIETIAEVEIDGVYGWDLSGPCVPSNTGGDEFSIVFKGV